MKVPAPWTRGGRENVRRREEKKKKGEGRDGKKSVTIALISHLSSSTAAGRAKKRGKEGRREKRKAPGQCPDLGRSGRFARGAAAIGVPQREWEEEKRKGKEVGERGGGVGQPPGPRHFFQMF